MKEEYYYYPPRNKKCNIRECHKQLYTNRSDNLNKIDKYLETQNLPKVIQKEKIQNL